MNAFLHQGGLLIPGQIISQNPETLATIFQGTDGCGYPCVPNQIITDRHVARDVALGYLAYWSRMAQVLSEDDVPLPGEEE